MEHTRLHGRRSLAPQHRRVAADQDSLPTCEQWEIEMQTGLHVQQQILAGPVPRGARYDAAAVVIPAGIVGGDYYDFLPRPGDNLRVVVADVMGKGVGAALILAMVRMAVRVVSPHCVTPASLLTELNRLLYADLQMLGAFATVACVDLIFDQQRLECASAGHPDPLRLRRGAEVERLRPRGTMLGVTAGRIYTQEAADLLPGDEVILYSDGLIEARNPRGQQLGNQGLEKLLMTVPPGTAEETKAAILSGLWAFADGRPLGDDLTLAVMRVLREPSA